jgi:hypothetical protein
MPIRNMGTLLENIVLVEAMRVLSQGNHINAPIEFLNSFVMPPLSQWIDHATDYGISAAHLDALRQGQPPPLQTYQGLLYQCLQHPPEQPGTLGPNGALLSALLTCHAGARLRMWLNDIPQGHYPNTLPALAAIEVTVQAVGALPAPWCCDHLVICETPWPGSLVAPAPNNLTATLQAWGATAHARLGYLDPNRYRILNGQGPETDSSSHRTWLALLATGTPRPVISVHFTAHRNYTELRPEVQQLHADGVAEGYQRTLMTSHSYYHTVCNIRHPDGEAAAHQLATELQAAVQSAWAGWFAAIGAGANALNTVVLP